MTVAARCLIDFALSTPHNCIALLVKTREVHDLKMNKIAIVQPFDDSRVRVEGKPDLRTPEHFGIRGSPLLTLLAPTHQSIALSKRDQQQG